jgi:hypothetical protein
MGKQVGRLIETKGLLILFDAMEIVPDLTGLSVCILGAACEKFVGRAKFSISLLGQVRYGPHSFVFCADLMRLSFLRYRTNSQGLSLTHFSSCSCYRFGRGRYQVIVDRHENGILLDTADSGELGRSLQYSAVHRCDLRKMGLSALKKSRQFTHDRMHYARSAIIADEIRRRSS